MTTNTNNYFDLITTGAGYVNKLAWIPTRGTPYLIANLCLLSGAADNTNKHYVFTTVKGKAVEFLTQYIDQINQALQSKKPVFVRVQIGDIAPDSYQGSTGLKLKMTGRLIKVSYLKIGDIVIDIPKEDEKAVQPMAQQQEAVQQPPVQQQQAPANVSNNAMSEKDWEAFQAFKAWQMQSQNA